MNRDDILLLRGNEIAALLEGRERAIIDTIRVAYLAHESGDSNLPHSTFLRIPDQPRNRIIALPAFLGDGFQTAGVKWIASFPENVSRGMERASAVIILNSATDGRPQAILEGSVISAQRTAASAALAAEAICESAPHSAGLIGCGVINHEIARFLLATFPGLKRFVLYDRNRTRADAFVARTGQLCEGLEFDIRKSAEEVLAETTLTVFATTAVAPHVSDISMCPNGAVVLHISLRDLTPEVILASNNIVDDIDHVCRAQTSVHLAEQQVGSRSFIRGTLAGVLQRKISARTNPARLVVFSPFGLGVLDLALASLALRTAQENDRGTAIQSFFPESAISQTTGGEVSR
jgi:2,3-diaminopropionate biosynthesis protein SbnB